MSTRSTPSLLRTIARNDRAASPGPDVAGFALVGVMMFTFVLTIIALSLYSLSGYEASFLYKSLRRSQAFYSAMGGFERAKFVLLRAGSRLEQVQENLPREDVTYAEARQGTDWPSAETAGPIDWNGDPIWLRVRAQVRDADRTFESRFQPIQPRDIYRHLFSLAAPSDPLTVVTYFGAPPVSTYPRWSQTRLPGVIWLNTAPIPPSSADSVAWLPPNIVNPPAFSPTYEAPGGPGVPAPDVAGYFSRWSADATGLPEPTSSSPITLDASFLPNGVGHWKTFGPGSNPMWSVDWSAANCRLRVNGTAIWMLDRGLRMTSKLEVDGMSGGPQDLLVIVAGKNFGDPNDPQTGIALKSSIESDAPVFLVSNGTVKILHEGNPTENCSVPYLSVFANKLVVMGPHASNSDPVSGDGGPYLILAHPSLLPEPLSALIDLLWQLALLPNTDAGLTTQLTAIPGTWSEITPPGSQPN